MSFFITWGLIGLFLSSFLAATIIPLGSEVVFSALFLGGFDPWTCVAVATLGNWLGGLTSYYVGYLGKLEWIEKYLGVKKKKLAKFEQKMKRYGNWLSFFSFLPGVGDIIAVGAGYFRGNFWIVAVAMLLGKFLRYVVWMYLNGVFL